MTEPLWRDGPWELLLDLKQLVTERAPVESQLGTSLSSTIRALQRRHHRMREEVDGRLTVEKETAEDEFRLRQQATAARFEAQQATAQSEHEQARREIAARFETDHHAARDVYQEARWHAGALFEAAKTNVTMQINEVQSQWEALWIELDRLEQDAVRTMRRRWQRAATGEPLVGRRPSDDPFQRVNELSAQARGQFAALQQQSIPRMFKGFGPLVMLFVCWAVMVGPMIYWLGWNDWWWLAASGGAGLLLCLVVGGALFRIGQRQSARAHRALRQTLVDAGAARQAAAEAIKAKGEEEINAAAARRHVESKKAEDQYNARLAELTAHRDEELRKIDQRHQAALEELTHRRDSDQADAESVRQARLQQLAEQHAAQVARLDQRHADKQAEIEREFEQHWDVMAQRWNSGIQRVQASADEMNRAAARLFLDWHSPDWMHWTPAAQMPSGVAVARFDVSLDQFPDGIPGDDRLRPAQTSYSLPAMFPCRDRSLLLLKSDGGGLPAATAAIQTIMLRMLTAMPPAKIRFTVVDPVSLGESFSAFMHLADYNEQLVSSRIWTEPGHIEHRLAELTGHMENVIQVYLRNEFQSIDEYNKFAGDLAEPYRVLIVSNFPAGFSESAAARLQSIIASGARCGVYTVLSVDTRQRMPRGFQLADVERQALSLSWRDGRFVWENPDVGPLPVHFLEPPPADRFTTIVRNVGRAAKDADRVEVPFAAIVPDRAQWWTSESRDGIDVPLGRAGAMKLQYLRLGKGTSQHVLIAGKTGSGKSTLLHALITSVGVRYSPDEVELYLIDFKKGVEFKAYAQAALPHARVVAIESEREFGLSVLERLDVELRQRGDLFRQLGVQDVAGFRAARPGVRMPRILLIIDEFQELFVEDDRIAQQAALLLDRLVRQGRAFGIHALLGSQTLAGSYSLPRSTIGQMAVRIALQCSESDAHLILSEDNTAARLLKRPGEAIYNDANGLFEGNHPFQVVWLSEDQREAYLREVYEYAAAQKYPVRPQIVFEGNAPADASRNEALQTLLEAPRWPELDHATRVWLGAAVAIKEATAIEFARQTGSNLLIVGHQEEGALGLLSMALLSLAAQVPPRFNAAGLPEPVFYILDGSRPDGPNAGMWNRLSRALPHEVRISSIRGVAELVRDVAEELARREQSPLEEFPPVYLMIFDLARFRDLRRAEDDFSFGRLDEDKPVPPSALLGKILREGPALGIHTLLWCDTYTNVNRALDRQGLRELELRVLFQMNATDSSNLIDGPAAAHLGAHRALYYNEGQGRFEKFRPYGLPPDTWLAWVGRQLHARVQSQNLPADQPV